MNSLPSLYLFLSFSSHYNQYADFELLLRTDQMVHLKKKHFTQDTTVLVENITRDLEIIKLFRKLEFNLGSKDTYTVITIPKSRDIIPTRK